MAAFSAGQVAGMLGIRPSRLRRLADSLRGGEPPPPEGAAGMAVGFDSAELELLRSAGQLEAARVAPRRIHQALRAAGPRLRSARSSGVRLTLSGGEVLVAEGATLWRPESGQLLFPYLVQGAGARAPAGADAAEAAAGWYELGCRREPSSPVEARRAYERAAELDPGHADARVNLGRLRHEAGDPAGAERHYRAALAADPGHAIAAYDLGVALEDLGRPAEARTAYLEALERDPLLAEAHFNLSRLYEGEADRGSALRHLLRYRELAGAEGRGGGASGGAARSPAGRAAGRKRPPGGDR